MVFFFVLRRKPAVKHFNMRPASSGHSRICIHFILHPQTLVPGVHKQRLPQNLPTGQEWTYIEEVAKETGANIVCVQAEAELRVCITSSMINTSELCKVTLVEFQTKYIELEMNIMGPL